MKYSQEMILQSPSGYCMPFEEHDKEVEMTLGYGKQLHPKTGVEFFHHGVDFSAPHYLLSAVASGIVSGIGNDTQRGAYLVIRYGDYEVSYGHLSSILVGYGDGVGAGQTVGVSDDVLHLETRYKGEEFDPIEFLTMIYGNIKSMERRGETFGKTDFREMAGGFRTKYDKDAGEIEELMLRFFPAYLKDLGSGEYRLPQRTEQSLRNMLMMASARNYFFEMIPSMENPMGLGHRSIPLAAKVQNLLLEDFLGYLALRHGTYLSGWDDGVKKKVLGQALADSDIIDPLEGLDITVQSFDIPRTVSVYPDQAGIRWWTKAWFNNRKDGEASVEISRQNAILFIRNQVEKDAWLEEHFPRQMEVYHNAIEQTRQQLLAQQINL